MKIIFKNCLKKSEEKIRNFLNQKCTYVLLESISCDRRRFLLIFAEENTVGLIRSSNTSLLVSPNDFNVETFGCGTVFG